VVWVKIARYAQTEHFYHQIGHLCLLQHYIAIVKVKLPLDFCIFVAVGGVDGVMADATAVQAADGTLIRLLWVCSTNGFAQFGNSILLFKHRCDYRTGGHKIN
jgi:hypothetical protein